MVPRTLLVTTNSDDQHGAAPSSPLVGGLALSAAIIVGGLWVTGRSRRRAGALVALVLLVTGAGAVLADIASPFGSRLGRGRGQRLPIGVEEPRLEALPLPASVSLPKNIKMEIVTTGETIRLLIPAKPTGAPAKPGAPRATEAPKP
jgi:hypothetical protein